MIKCLHIDLKTRLSALSCKLLEKLTRTFDPSDSYEVCLSCPMDNDEDDKTLYSSDLFDCSNLDKSSSSKLLFYLSELKLVSNLFGLSSFLLNTDTFLFVFVNLLIIICISYHINSRPSFPEVSTKNFKQFFTNSNEYNPS